MRKTKFIEVHLCTNCDSEISESDRMYNNGVCPHCGYKGDYAITICETKFKIKQVWLPKWWEFWKLKN